MFGQVGEIGQDVHIHNRTRTPTHTNIHLIAVIIFYLQLLRSAVHKVSGLSSAWSWLGVLPRVHWGCTTWWYEVRISLFLTNTTLSFLDENYITANIFPLGPFIHFHILIEFSWKRWEWNWTDCKFRKAECDL